MYSDWVGMRSKVRLSFLIDSEPIVAYDLKQSHPHLIYAMAGKKLDGDIYTLLCPENRNAGKIAWMILLDSRSEGSFAGKLRRNETTRPWAAGIIINLKINIPEIVIKTIFKNKNIRQLATKKESDLMIEVLSKLLSRNILPLPVHDEIYVKKSDAEEALSMFEDVLQEYHRENMLPMDFESKLRILNPEYIDNKRSEREDDDGKFTEGRVIVLYPYEKWGKVA